MCDGLARGWRGLRGETGPGGTASRGKRPQSCSACGSRAQGETPLEAALCAKDQEVMMGGDEATPSDDSSTETAGIRRTDSNVRHREAKRLARRTGHQ